VQNFENRLGFDKATESSKMVTFLRHSVYYSAPKSHRPTLPPLVTAKKGQD